MSIPVDYTSALLKSLSQDRLNNLIAQADARRILQEVKESPENYPAFDPLLTEKVTHIAYALLSCGCSLIEGADDSADEAENLGILERAGKLLSDAYRYNDSEADEKNYNLLIAGMALYAAKQYSRAFIVLKDINLDFSVGQLIIQFVKKDFNSLLKSTSRVFFEDFCELSDIQVLDEWVISHEIARIFMIITDYVQTGNKDDFTIIDDIFNKLLLVAVDSNLISFWLIIRLLRIILSTYFKASLWSVLPPLLSSQYTTKNYIQLLSGFVPPVTELWPSQVAAIPLAVGENDGGIINLRTSGGKTRVAEIAIINTLSSNSMSKVLYLAPFRSLAFEVEQSLSKVFNPLGITVSQLYGGSTANLTDFELINESQVVIATPEKAKALIRCGSGLETKIKLIVVDEGHLLGAEERYIKNEMFLTHIKEFASRNQIRMLLLSAVLPNANELAEWIAADSNLVAKSEWKPSLERLGLLLWDGTRVRLQWKSDGEPFNPNFVQKAPLGFGRRRNPFPNDKKEAIAATAVRLAQTGTVMIYSAKANAINGLAESVLLALGEHPNDFEWDKSLWNAFESVCKEELGDSDIVLTAAKKGVICHAEDQIEQTNNIVREIEIWSNANAANLMEFVPNQTILDNFRHCWISGMPLSEIINSEPNAAKISKDYYGYTLPWIIHAISQMFDSESEQIFIQVYSSIALFVELGLPNVTSSNIYLAGVRSRGAALELSNFDVFQNKSISEVKQILSSFQLQDCEISETTKAWIKLLSDSANSQKPKEVSFPAFTWKRNGLPDKLYLRETNGDCFLISEDGYFYEKVESTSELPFLKIANILGLYFERDDDIWNLRSNNPKITVR